MDLRHSKATLISLGAVDTTGVPALNQVARFFDADTVQGSANFTFTGTILALTGNMTISAFLAVGATPAAAGTIRIPNAGSITMRNASDNGDINVWSSPMSDEINIGDTTIPTLRILATGTRIRNSMRLDGEQFGETTQFLTSPRTVLTPSGQTATIAGAIPTGVLVLGISLRVITAITGPATFSIGDGVDPDRWGAGIAVGLGTIARGTAQTSAVVEFFPAGNDIVITSDGVDFTGGEVRVIIHYVTFTAPTS